MLPNIERGRDGIPDATFSAALSAPGAFTCYQATRIDRWNRNAQAKKSRSLCRGYYHRRLTQIYQFLVAPGQRVLEIGCGQGDLMAALNPSTGVGIDFSPEMLGRARKRHPHLRFIQTDAHELTLDETFDVIILSDVINDLWDVQLLLDRLRPLTSSTSRLIFNMSSHLWEQPIGLAQRLRMATPTLPQNWLTVEDVAGLLNLSEFEVVRSWREILFPIPIPLLGNFCNRFIVKLWPFYHLALTNFIVARPQAQRHAIKEEPLVSVIIPARNEAGNIARIFREIPEMGRATELVFVEGHSRDNTYTAIEQAIAAHPERRCRLMKQTGIGKGDAVRLGFAEAAGDIVMILDADLTVAPADLPRFYEALRSGKGEFINGVRLVYPMEKQAMRFLNLFGNKFFSLAFTWLLGQPIKDSLCGTKALWKKDYDRISANRRYFGDFDPFGDFDLLFGAARLNLKILDLPIRYRERTYGATNIQRWKHGWLLLRMVLFAANRIKFI